MFATLAATLAMVAWAPTAGADDWWNEQPGIVRPDDRADARGPGAVVSADAGGSAVRPDDRPGPRRPEAAYEATPAAAAGLTDRFDWRDAGIGAAFAFGLVALRGGALLVARHRKASFATV